MSADRSADEERALEWARRWVYERLALISAVIWAVGTFLLFVNLVPPDISRPQREIVVSMMLPLIPAGLPWIFYPAIARHVARRRLHRQGGT